MDIQPMDVQPADPDPVNLEQFEAMPLAERIALFATLGPGSPALGTGTTSNLALFDLLWNTWEHALRATVWLTVIQRNTFSNKSFEDRQRAVDVSEVIHTWYTIFRFLNPGFVHTRSPETFAQYVIAEVYTADLGAWQAFIPDSPSLEEYMMTERAGRGGPTKADVSSDDEDETVVQDGYSGTDVSSDDEDVYSESDMDSDDEDETVVHADLNGDSPVVEHDEIINTRNKVLKNVDVTRNDFHIEFVLDFFPFHFTVQGPGGGASTFVEGLENDPGTDEWKASRDTSSTPTSRFADPAVMSFEGNVIKVSQKAFNRLELTRKLYSTADLEIAAAYSVVPYASLALARFMEERKPDAKAVKDALKALYDQVAKGAKEVSQLRANVNAKLDMLETMTDANAIFILGHQEAFLDLDEAAGVIPFLYADGTHDLLWIPVFKNQIEIYMEYFNNVWLLGSANHEINWTYNPVIKVRTDKALHFRLDNTGRFLVSFLGEEKHDVDIVMDSEYVEAVRRTKNRATAADGAAETETSAEETNGTAFDKVEFASDDDDDDFDPDAEPEEDDA